MVEKRGEKEEEKEEEEKKKHNSQRDKAVKEGSKEKRGAARRALYQKWVQEVIELNLAII